MRATLTLLHRQLPELEVDGEMHGDSALDEAARMAVLSGSTLHGSANLLVCPQPRQRKHCLQFAQVGGGHNVAIGPILLGCAAPAHILTPAATVRRNREYDGRDGVEAKYRGRDAKGRRARGLAAGRADRRGEGGTGPKTRPITVRLRSKGERVW